MARDANDILRQGGGDAVRQVFDCMPRDDGSGRRGNGADHDGGGAASDPSIHRVERRVIRLEPGLYAPIAEASEDAMLAAGQDIYRRDQTLVRPLQETVTGARNTRTVTAALVPVLVQVMRQVMEQSATYVRYDARKDDWVPVRPPKEIAELILARAGFWPFRPIAGVITTPTLRPDGTVLDTPGYDPATQLYLAAPPPMPPLPGHPTREDARAALELLKELLDEFPFVDGASRAVALAALITPVVRGAMITAPLMVFSAPAAGTGKSYLADLAAGIASGFPCPVQSLGSGEEETEKRLNGTLIAGYPLLSLDNVNGELAGDFLCQLVERPLIEVRPLGASTKLRIQPRNLTLFATGNNVLVSGDLARRALVARLDAGLEDPHTRQFKRDPLAMIMADRGAYIAAALTIVRAYRLAGMPDRLPPLASFQDWSDHVRSALVWLGCDDPCATMSRATNDDPRRQAAADLFKAWETDLGVDTEWTVAGIIEAAAPGLDDKPNLRDAVGAVARDRKGNLDPNRLGQWLRRHKDRIFDGLKLSQAGQTDKRTRWVLSKQTAEGGQGGQRGADPLTPHEMSVRVE